MSNVRLHVSPSRPAGSLVSRSPNLTGPKDKPTRHKKPGALIIQEGVGRLRQINVFYNAALALNCNLSSGGGA